MSVVVHHGDCRDIIPALGVMVDAVVTDPPYGLEFMGEDWDAPWQVSSKSALFGKRERATPGWGTTRNANCRKCGGRLRGAKKCSCPEPDWDEAPNSTHLRQMIGYAEWCADWASAVYDVLRPGGFLLAFGGTRTVNWLACGIEMAGFTKQDEILWLYGSGFPKNKAHLKPAYEPIVLAYKLGGKRTMQVDECRIDAGSRPLRDARANIIPSMFGAMGGSKAIGKTDIGRWPANICHDGSAEVLAGFPVTSSWIGGNATKATGGIWASSHDRENGASCGPQIGDSGSAARFFYSAKADAHDRWGSRHPTVKPVELVKWLVALVTPPGGTVLDPFAGSGTTGIAAFATGRNCILIEREAEYIADIRERLAHYQGEGRHSLAVKARRVADKPLGGLFERPYDADADSLGSYLDAIKACEERYKAGEPLGEFFLSTRKDEP